MSESTSLEMKPIVITVRSDGTIPAVQTTSVDYEGTCAFEVHSLKSKCHSFSPLVSCVGIRAMYPRFVFPSTFLPLYIDSSIMKKVNGKKIIFLVINKLLSFD